MIIYFKIENSFGYAEYPRLYLTEAIWKLHLVYPEAVIINYHKDK